jgi:flavin-dependent dehydrogenase
MSGTYDVIVVGARCAGASTAMLLARNGLKVLLVDRAKFPSDIPHGHLIHRHGPRRLRDWGLLERLVASGCPPITTITRDTGPFPLVGRDLVIDGVAAAYGPRRIALDKLLIDGALEAGVELRDGFAAEEYTGDGNRVTGIRGRDRTSAARVTERAAITVGADGRGSHLARTVRATEYEVTPTVACWYFSYWSGVPSNGLELYERGERAIFGHPTNDGLFALFVGWPISRQQAVQSDLERSFMAVFDLVPGLSERVRGGRREERFYGAANLPNFLRKPFGPGWALVGDAGCHKDPYLALGICDALRDAALLAEAISQGLSGRRSIDKAMADYERHRNAATLTDYRLNLELAQFKPRPSEEHRLREALCGNQEATNRFFMAREGMIPPETFFDPQNLKCLMAAVGEDAVRAR